MPSGDAPEPVFFLDRSLGGVQVPQILREAGIEVVTLSEHYGVPEDQSIADVEWLELAGSRHWPVLMKDSRIRYRAPERAALLAHGVQAFCLTNANLKAAQMAEEFLESMERIRFAIAVDRPCLYAVRSGRIERLDVS